MIQIKNKEDFLNVLSNCEFKFSRDFNINDVIKLFIETNGLNIYSDINILSEMLSDVSTSDIKLSTLIYMLDDETKQRLKGFF